ncbi:MAG: aldo/keto reductase [Oscillospiraceae bacterium]
MYNANEERYNLMQYERSGASGLKLPRVSLGLWHNFGSVDVQENMQKILRTAFDCGITHFDMANNYGPVPGSAEENFGILYKKDFIPYRDELILSSKAGYHMWEGPYGEWGSRKNMLASLDASLKRTGLEYFDIFYSHRFDPDTPLEETMGALSTAVHSGKALYAGISNYNGEQTRKALAILKELHCPCVINQSRYSIFDRTIESNGLLSTANTENLGIIAFSPLAQGLLTDKYLHGIPDDSRIRKSGIFLKETALTSERLAQISALNDMAAVRGESLSIMALRWVLAKGACSVLVGASSAQQISANAKAADKAIFTDDELSKIDDIAGIKN